MGLVSSVGAMAFLLALVPTTAQAATQIRDDPSDAPPGAFGKADVRTVAWDLGGASAQLTVGVDESTYGAGERAPIGVHVLLDADGNESPTGRSSPRATPTARGST